MNLKTNNRLSVEKKSMSEKNVFFETEIEHWNDLILLNHGFVSKFVYRGQSDSKWGLSSSLERMVKLFHPYASNYDCILDCYTQNILKDFKWKYPVYSKEPAPDEDDLLEWCSILQHYGAPTRMVDFTYSPYIALFMAIDNSSADYCSVWCLNHHVYEFSINEEFSKKTGENFINPFELEKYIHNEVCLRLRGCVMKDAQPGIFLVRPRRSNERICRQQGLFAIQGDMSISFEENVFSKIANKEAVKIPFSKICNYSDTPLGTYKQADIALIKINISTKLRLELMKYLNQININAETMYPGLEGLAKSMAFPRMEMG